MKKKISFDSVIKKIINTVRSQLGKRAYLKSWLLQIWDYYHQSLPLVVGMFIRIPAYLKNIMRTKVIAKPGTLSFGGGAFNPGALQNTEGKLLLLAKAQKIPWFNANGARRKDYMTGSPAVFILNPQNLQKENAFALENIMGFPENTEFAIEDFRMFYWKGNKMVNHSLTLKGENGELSALAHVSASLSVLDERGKKLTFRAMPVTDFPLQPVEKNWLYKEHDNRLFLFYSVIPYKVLILEDEETFTFKTVVNQQLNSEINDPGRFGTRVSFSTNPVDYNDQYWVVIIHQIRHKITGRCYYHWALLIDKITLLPVRITKQPIFNGMGARGRVPGYRYISSILKVDDEILFFAGEGDVFVTVTKKKIGELDSLFVSL